MPILDSSIDGIYLSIHGELKIYHPFRMIKPSALEFLVTSGKLIGPREVEILGYDLDEGPYYYRDKEFLEKCSKMQLINRMKDLC